MRGLSLQKFIDNMFGNANDTGERPADAGPLHVSREVLGVDQLAGGYADHSRHGICLGGQDRQEGFGDLGLLRRRSHQHGRISQRAQHGRRVQSADHLLLQKQRLGPSAPRRSARPPRPPSPQKAEAYGVPGVRVDGNDLFAVIAVVRQALERAKCGQGPTLVEALTYRMGGHSTSDDPDRYRESDQLAPWAAMDPIERVRRYLEKRGRWNQVSEDRLVEEIRQPLQAIRSSWRKRRSRLGLESLFDDVYEDLPWHLAEQRDELVRGPRAPKSH